MKFLHTADLHLGKTLGGHNLADDQRFILRQICKLATERQVDAVLIAGDVYDRAVPPTRALDLLDEFLVQLAGRRIAVGIVAGNHDDPARLAFASRLLASRNVHIAGEYDGSVPRVRLGGVNIYLLPFVRAKTVACFHKEDDVQTQTDAVRVALAHAGIDRGAVNVLVTHQFVAGNSERMVPARSSGTLIVGNVERVDAGVFDGFAYVALGHLHTAHQVGGRPVYYAGSPLMYSLTDARQPDNARRVYCVDLDEASGAAAVEAVPLQPLRNLRMLRGTMADLREHAVDTDDYVYATLTDDAPVLDAMSRLRDIYPRAVGLAYESKSESAGGGGSAAQRVEGKSLEQILADFYRLRMGKDISDEAMAEFLSVAQECEVATA